MAINCLVVPDAMLGRMQCRLMCMPTVDTLLQRIDMLDQRRQCLTDGIRQAAVFQVCFFARGMDRMLTHDDLSRHTDDH